VLRRYLQQELLRGHHLSGSALQLGQPRRDWWLVGSVALAVRLAHAYFVSRTPFFAGPVIDAAVNRGLALQLAATGDTGGAFYQPPLYAAFLSLLFRLGLRSPWSVAVVQASLGALTAVLLVEIGRRLASRPELARAVGLASGLGAALFGPLVLYDLELLPPCLVDLLLATCSLLALRRGPLGPLDALLGLAGGLAIVGWPPSALLLPMCLLLRARRLEAGKELLVALSLSAALLPVAVTARYNAHHGGQGVVVSYNFGINLWLGNNPNWRDTWRARPGASFEPELERPDRRGATTPAARSAYFTARVLDDVKARPLAFLARTAEKFYYVFGGREIRRDQDLQTLREASPVLRALLWEHGLAFPFGALGPLGILALWRRRRDSDARIVALAIVGYALLLAVFFVSSRYRLPLVLLLLPFAAEQALVLLQQRQAARASLWALAGGAVLLNWPSPFTASFAASPAERGVLEASAWRNQGQLERAAQISAQLVRSFPNDPNVLMLRAELLAASSRCREAEPLLAKTRELAPRTAAPRLLLAECYEARGDLRAAERELGNALALHPFHPQALRRASLLFLQERRSREAGMLASRFLASGYRDPELERVAALTSP
jgi:tetratricopeptide (TPR) repeat protein